MKPQHNMIVLDIETSARVGLFFGNTYKASIAKVVQDMYVFGFSWKPLGKKVRSCYVWDFPLYKKDPRNDVEVIKKWIEVVSEAQVVIGHNSRSFDDKVMMGRVIHHQLPPPLPFATIDTKADLTRVSKNDSNKLDDLGNNYGYGRKQSTGGIDLWWDCMLGEKKAMKKMVSYCERDVKLTEKVYFHERPYIKHPNLNVINNRPDSCPRCGKDGTMNAGMKYKATNTNLYQYYRCKECGGMAKARLAEYKQTEERVKFV